MGDTPASMVGGRANNVVYQQNKQHNFSSNCSEPPATFILVVAFVLTPKVKERNVKAKTILTIAIIAPFPFGGVYATGPAAYSGNSPTLASMSAPYQIVTPGEHDDEHIASTKYVIGAYNDAIAAVNKVDDEKQGKLYTAFGVEIDSEAADPGVLTYEFDDLVTWGTGLSEDTLDKLVTGEGVAAAIQGYMGAYIRANPITIYTNWDDDTATGAATIFQ